MTQLTLDQRMKEAERQEAVERYLYAPYGTKRDRQARAIAATCAALQADIDAGKSVPGRNGARR